MTSSTFEELDKSACLQEFAADVREGLRAKKKSISPKYFYDERGSQLFEEICRQPEYYPTRTETLILKKYSPHIAKTCNGKPLAILELGSGSSMKTMLLFNAFMKRKTYLHYIPVDISHSMLQQTAEKISDEFCDIHITPIPADYYTGISKASKSLASTKVEKKLVLFLGSSIGNFEPQETEYFLRTIGRNMNTDDLIIIGFDLHKPKAILESAYNDKSGVTEKFNLNLLARINKELDGNFDLSSFSHRAFYNKSFHRIEMHLVSLRRQSVYIGKLDEIFDFAKGETIHTENSYKYTISHIEDLAEKCGFKVKKHYLDENQWFDLALLSRLG